MVTRSSIFETSEMANPPSCGMAKAAMNPPKMAWTPMMSVTNAEAKTRKSVKVLRNEKNEVSEGGRKNEHGETHIMSGEGCPFSMDPVLTAR